MRIKKEQEETIINFGAFDYDIKKMANILDKKEKEINDELKNENSLFCKLYQKGRDMADYTIDLKLFKMIQNGDLKALEKLEERKWDRKNKNK